jgi:hypothetical protein
MIYFASNNLERQQNAIVRAGVLVYRVEHGDWKVSASFSKPEKPAPPETVVLLDFPLRLTLKPKTHKTEGSRYRHQNRYQTFPQHKPRMIATYETEADHVESRPKRQ